MTDMLLEIKKLNCRVANKTVLKDIDLMIDGGEVVAMMGPNGSGKSSLAHCLIGHPDYLVVSGQINFAGKSILGLSPDERARQGLFLAFQYPVGIAGVNVREVLLASLRARGEKISALELKKVLEDLVIKLDINPELLTRDLNQGFSGGEKKKMEMLQLLVLKPRLAILDETDSGLDIDALKTVALGAREVAKTAHTAILVITHYQRLLNYLEPDRALVLKDGKLIDSGGKELVEELEKNGYKAYD